MELQSIKISTIRNDVWVYLDVLDIAEPVSAAPHVRLKAGVWLLANTMRWFRNASETLVRLIPRLRLGHDQVVLSAKASLLKAPPLSLKNPPQGTSRLTFIHSSAIGEIIRCNAFRRYYASFVIDPIDCVSSSLLNFFFGYCGGGGGGGGLQAAIVTPPPPPPPAPPGVMGRPRKPFSALRSRSYARRAIQSRVLDPFAQVLAGGPIDGGVATGSEARRNAMGMLLTYDKEFQKVAVATVVACSPLRKRLYNEAGFYRDLVHGFAVPLWRALLLKDMTRLSDQKYALMTSKASSRAVLDSFQLPRTHRLIAYRKCSDDFVAGAFGLVDYADETVIRAVCDIEKVCRMQLYAAAARGEDLDAMPNLRWKLTFDGTDAGGKSLLSFAVIPLSFNVRIQSNTIDFPLAVA